MKLKLKFTDFALFVALCAIFSTGIIFIEDLDVMKLIVNVVFGVAAMLAIIIFRLINTQ